jgi:hypothetical protein
MPIHDWKRLEAGDFHDFHQCWIVEIRNALNTGLLPPGYIAMAEQVTGRPIPDVVTLHAGASGEEPQGDGGAVAIAEAPPRARLTQKLERLNYAKRADRVVIRHGRGKVVAIIEIVSPGNKDSQNSIRAFVQKAADILTQGVSLLVVDLFPRTPRDPHGIHQAIWAELGDEPFEEISDKPFVAAAFLGGDFPEAYAEPLAVGDELPSLPIFLSSDRYVPAPLEATYERAWDVFPAILKGLMGAAE